MGPKPSQESLKVDETMERKSQRDGSVKGPWPMLLGIEDKERESQTRRTDSLQKLEKTMNLILF